MEHQQAEGTVTPSGTLVLTAISSVVLLSVVLLYGMGEVVDPTSPALASHPHGATTISPVCAGCFHNLYSAAECTWVTLGTAHGGW